MITDGLLLYLIIELHLSSAAAKTFLRVFFFFFWCSVQLQLLSFIIFMTLDRLLRKDFFLVLFLNVCFFMSSDCAVSFRAKVTTLGHCHLINIWCNTREILQIDMHRYIYIHV